MTRAFDWRSYEQYIRDIEHFAMQPAKINPNVPLYTTITVTHADGSNAPGGNAVHIFERLLIMRLLGNDSVATNAPVIAHVMPGSVQLAP